MLNFMVIVKSRTREARIHLGEVRRKRGIENVRDWIGTVSSVADAGLVQSGLDSTATARVDPGRKEK